MPVVAQKTKRTNEAISRASELMNDARYEESGKIVDNAERPSYFICVWGTETGNPNVGFDFDTETLTFNVRDDADWTESRTGAIEEREWKLKITM